MAHGGFPAYWRFSALSKENWKHELGSNYGWMSFTLGETSVHSPQLPTYSTTIPLFPRTVAGKELGSHNDERKVVKVLIFTIPKNLPRKRVSFIGFKPSYTSFSLPFQLHNFSLKHYGIL
ncbi:hypothetical protein E2C01_060919 [Portunus trituberculatus]|uniref:Uncharacterized protein n=1 Tax=Portunus trituberculatus TaxID=210409 RepID=A0A5B7H9Z9_PORTR|nr:hypothetical protein [Portunus trituberculatus]